MGIDNAGEGLAWQQGVWDRMSGVYLDEVDKRFVPVVDGVVRRAGIARDSHVLDLGTGTGSVALRVAAMLGSEGRIVGHDISPEMLRVASGRARDRGISNVEFKEGRAESIPEGDGTFEVVLASLSFMYVIDRAAAAREIARVLEPGGRFVAAVWAGPEECDIVRFQQTAGSFAPPPPVAGVGPGALADPGPFLEQLEKAGMSTHVEAEDLGFEFDDFESAWDVLAGVTTAKLSEDDREKAKRAVRELMWSDPGGARAFRNKTLFLVGERR